MIALIFLFFFGSGQAIAEERIHLCGRVFSDRPIRPDLDAVEKRLVCGEDREGWSDIPLNQARFHLKTFLQKRGYHGAAFTVERGEMTVKPGDPVRISGLEAPGAPEEVDVSRRRKIKGEILTPEKLNETEAWVRARLRQNGYACPTVTSNADPATGSLKVAVQSGPRFPISRIDEEASELASGILRRYDAFNVGEYFDEREIALTERRILSDGIVQAATVDATCVSGGVRLLQKTVPGLPRTFTFGIGVNTEDYIILRVGWKHSRITSMASLVEVTATASKPYQEIVSSMKWYLLPFATRFYMAPEFSVRREDEPKYETVTLKGRLRPSTDWDFDDWFVKLGVGPAVEQTQLLRGIGAGFTRLFLLETEIVLVGHEFEYYRTEPQSGAQLALKSNHVLSHNTADIKAQQLEAKGEWLWNAGGYEPPLLVVGGRFGLSTTISDSPAAVATFLPVHFRYFLGGLSTLRGFGRQELPYHGTGALTAAYGGVELRATAVLPQNLQPYLFADAGAVGGSSWSLDPDVYWSPGLGIRWNSPIGVFRFNAAYGFVANRQPLTPESLSHAQFYVAYGEEF